MRSIDGRGQGSGNQARLMRALLAGTALSAFATLPAAAQNTTWTGAFSGAYTNGANWTANVPASTDTANFGTSINTSLSISSASAVKQWIFSNVAPNYDFDVDQNLTFVALGTTQGGIINNGSNAVAITMNHNTLSFIGSTTGNAFITTRSGATTKFDDTTSTAGSSTGSSFSRFVTEAGGTFDISRISSTFFNVGSIEGAGNYIIGSKSLFTGNALDATVSGAISGVGGQLVKFGTGTLTLSGLNTYTGATSVPQGTLRIDATGSIAPSVVTTVQLTPR